MVRPIRSGPRRNLIQVWAAACPRCEVRIGEACRDLRSPSGRLYGRRTHRERAKAVKEMKLPRVDRNHRAEAQTLTWRSWTGGVWTPATSTTSGSIVTPYNNRTWDQWVTGTTTATTITYDVNYTWQRWEARDNQYRMATEAEVAEIRRLAAAAC